jgi:hypothetical protein
LFSLQEALLHQKCDKRRLAVAEGVNYRPPTFPRCHVPTPDGRCNQRVLPLSRMCIDRILFLFQGFTFLSTFRSYLEKAIGRYLEKAIGSYLEKAIGSYLEKAIGSYLEKAIGSY